MKKPFKILIATSILGLVSCMFLVFDYMALSNMWRLKEQSINLEWAVIIVSFFIFAGFILIFFTLAVLLVIYFLNDKKNNLKKEEIKNSKEKEKSK